MLPDIIFDYPGVAAFWRQHCEKLDEAFLNTERRLQYPIRKPYNQFLDKFLTTQKKTFS
jgi:hypothetical protein